MQGDVSCASPRPPATPSTWTHRPSALQMDPMHQRFSSRSRAARLSRAANTRTSSRQLGMTLIELMVGVAIVAIVASVALPAFQTSMANSRVKGQANDLLTAFAVAKSEAVKLNTTVSVCPSNVTNTACDGSNWATGWLVMNGASVVRVFPALTGGTIVKPSATVSSISFTGTGFVSSSYNFDLCTGNSSAPKRRVELLPSGFASVFPNASSATTC